MSGEPFPARWDGVKPENIADGRYRRNTSPSGWVDGLAGVSAGAAQVVPIGDPTTDVHEALG